MEAVEKVQAEGWTILREITIGYLVRGHDKVCCPIGAVGVLMDCLEDHFGNLKDAVVVPDNFQQALVDIGRTLKSVGL